MKDLVDNNLSLGDKCYYIHNTKNGWNLAIVEVVEFKAKTLIVKFHPFFRIVNVITLITKTQIITY